MCLLLIAGLFACCIVGFGIDSHAPVRNRIIYLQVDIFYILNVLSIVCVPFLVSASLGNIIINP